MAQHKSRNSGRSNTICFFCDMFTCKDHHVIICGPCYGQYKNLEKLCHQKRLKRMHEGKPMLNKNGIPRIHPYEEEMKKRALEKSLENNSKQ